MSDYLPRGLYAAVYIEGNAPMTLDKIAARRRRSLIVGKIFTAAAFLAIGLFLVACKS